MTTTAGLLEVANLAAGYGTTDVLADICLRVPDGALVVLVGANGAGKTTLLSAIAGVIPSRGRIRFGGEELRDKAAASGETVSGRVARGMVLVPEGRQLFGEMTVRENLELGGYLRSRRERTESIQQVLLLFPRLGERLGQPAGTMSGGEQQMVAVARALVSRPRLLMLDEPSLGLAPRMIAELFRLLRRIRDQGTAVLLVEQNVRQALAIADYSYVLERGSIVAEGRGADLLATDLIQRAYLGSDVSGARRTRPALASPPEPRPPSPSDSSFTNRVPGDREEGPPMFDTSMLVNNQDTGAAGGKTFTRSNPMTGQAATRAAAASVADAVAAVDAAAAAFPAWAALGPNERRLKLLKAADILQSRTDDAVARMTDETGFDRAVGRVQHHAGQHHVARGGRHDHAGRRRGHPLRQARVPRVLVSPAGRRRRRHRALERAHHPGRARHRHAAGVRQHGGAQGVRELSSDAPSDRRGDARGRAGARGGQRRHQRARRRGGDRRCADRPPRGQAGELHRLDQGRPDHRRARRASSEAGVAGAGRQGAADRARRRRSGRRGQRGCLRRLRQPGPDLHVDRAGHRR